MNNLNKFERQLLGDARKIIGLCIIAAGVGLVGLIWSSTFMLGLKITLGAIIIGGILVLVRTDV